MKTSPEAIAIVHLRDASILDKMLDGGEDREMLKHSALNRSWRLEGRDQRGRLRLWLSELAGWCLPFTGSRNTGKSLNVE